MLARFAFTLEKGKGVKLPLFCSVDDNFTIGSSSKSKPSRLPLGRSQVDLESNIKASKVGQWMLGTTPVAAVAGDQECRSLASPQMRFDIHWALENSTNILCDAPTAKTNHHLLQHSLSPWLQACYSHYFSPVHASSHPLSHSTPNSWEHGPRNQQRF